MEIKDFNVGDIVYIFGGDRINDTAIKEAKVTKVGRKYVCVIPKDSMGESLFEVPEYDRDSVYLIENKDYGHRRSLYKTLTDIAHKREYDAMKKWIWGSYSCAQSHKYTYDQLKSVCAILNPNGEYDEEIYT